MKKLLSIALALCMALSLCVTTTWAAENTVTVNGTGYADLAAALTAANGITDAVTIDLQGNTHALNGLPYDNAALVNISKDTTFKNGTFDISGVNLTEGYECIFRVGAGVNAKFENVTFTGTNFSSAAGVIEVTPGASTEKAFVTLTNCKFNLTGEQSPNAAVLNGHGPDSSEFIITNCEFNLNNIQRILLLMTVDMTGTKITSTAGTDNNHAFRKVFGKIENSTITVSGHETGIKNDVAKDLRIKDSTVKLSGSTVNDLVLSDGAFVTLEGTSTLEYASIFEGWNKVILDLNGGTGVNTIITSANSFNTKDYTPTKEGYTFVGWADEDDKVWPANTTFTFAEDVMEMTLKAQWEETPVEPAHSHTRRQPTTTTTVVTPDTTTTDTVTSAKTFDAGIAVYAAMGVLSLTGSAWIVGKKRG